MSMARSWWRTALLLQVPLLVACGPTEDGVSPLPVGGPEVPDDCDPLVPTACMLPFPSDKYLVANAAGDGKRIVIPPTALPKAKGTEKHISAAVFEKSDGFSPGVAAMTHLPGATSAGLPTPDTIERSLEPDSPTVLIDTSTGERVPHFAELDLSHVDDERRALLIRPVVRLKDATRYIVAIRGVKDAAGAALPPTAAFRAFLDGSPYLHPSIEPRRALYADIFARLEAAGISRGDLQLAWDYTTASRENITGWAVAMRDDALAKVGASGPDYVIDTILDAPDEGIARQIDGRMTVPLYLDKPGTGASIVFGDDGLPAQNGTAEYPFRVRIPIRATTGTPGALLQYGHGLLGSRTQVGGDGLRALATRHNYVTFATDWIGMAEDDSSGLADMIAVGDIAEFRHTPERSLQGFVNALLAMRMMSGAFAQDPAVMFNGVSAIDTTQRFYTGDSQGGIFGLCYMALSTDVTRGTLGVPGQPYNLLLHRSVDFGIFFVLLRITFPDAIDQNIALALVQTLWDRAEPNGYSPYVTSNPLPGTPEHQVLLQVAIGDHQVSPLGAHIMARSVGAKAIVPPVRPIWGIEAVAGPHSGSAIVEYDFGLPAAPIENVPMGFGDDPHGKPRKLESAQDQMHMFFRTGMTENFCDGPCFYE